MKKPLIAYIYVIRNTVNGKIYVGSEQVKGGRFKEHKRNLNLQRHSNPYLQNSWNKYGEAAFTCEIVEECEHDDRFKREQWWINHLKSSDPKIGYNIIHAVRSLMPAKRRSTISKAIWARPGLKEQVAAESAKRWEDPAYKARMTAVSLAQWQDEGRKKRHKDRLAKLWSRPEMRENLRARNTQRWSSEEARKSHGDKIRAKWQTAEYREKQVQVRQKVMVGYLKYLQRKARTRNEIV